MAAYPVDIVDRFPEPLDRCDACGSRAFVVATMTAGPVFYCGHCATKFWVELTRQAVKVDDQRWRLYVEEARRHREEPL